ncbi:scopoletin glucosyltransferase [Cicer arietinum]|uniref:Glycosyltransferase n=1 Tax=Cicer arietinum TaxID=3827 RepID=A0A067XTH8_CICAR|nr:scopoletin glucosyltransferase [Cicer arietinum]AGU14084.1 UDP-glycosyltransferase [Cicer arietinum]
MASQNNPLHIFFFPFMGHGHMIPSIDMAKLFASKGVKATIVTTPLNKPLVTKAIEQFKTHSNNIDIQIIKFPCVEGGLPEGCENVDSIPSPHLIPAFFKATWLLQEPLEQLLQQQKPNCIVADMFFPWSTASAAKFGIPRIVFHGTSFFSLCASQCLNLYEPFKNVSSDTELFEITNLPGNIKMTKLQLPSIFTQNDTMTQNTAKLFAAIRESEKKSYGVIVNSFYELEHVYADYYRDVLGIKAWHIGPLSIHNKKDKEITSYRGKEDSIDKHECLKWLDTKEKHSVVYLCFGSTTHFLNSQLKEIAVGLEASGKNFIWVVNKKKEDGEEWLPEGFEKRMEGKGLVIRGWAPQVLILNHEAIGAFVTHCGWNSTFEGVSAGVPMITWPVAAEQFYNEKLVTEVLKIGVPVGVKKWVGLFGDSIQCDLVEKAVKRVMEGEEAEEMRNKAKLFAEMAKKAGEEGGSSYLKLNALIEELGSLSQHQPILQD